ncbi:MAG TPA: tetratricopeptide repeat-containing sensor histidine kinase [Melioribacteraceae bacterium]|nr:tetratricopeptide repeat-containing sensor histidine kinase [Melioribacteraceae bacterium]
MYKQILFLLLIFSCTLQSQNTIDSIRGKISSLDDSSKARVLLEETWKRRSNDPLAAIQLGKEALKIYFDLKDRSGEARANNYLGITYVNTGALEIAYEYHIAALRAAENAGNSIQVAYSYNNIGEIFRLKNNVVAATENIQRAIQIFESVNDQRGLAYCYVNMGRLYAAQEDPGRALELFEKSEKIAVSLNLEEMRGRILLAIARISQRSGDFSRAEKSYVALEKLYEKLNYQKGIAEVWSGLSDVLYRKGELRKALEYSFRSLDLNKKILNAVGEVNNLNSLAGIYLSLNNLKAGEEFLSLALKKSNELNSSSLIASTYKKYYELYKKSGRLDSALYYFEKFNTLKDSIVTKDEMIKLGELESLIKFEKSEREKEILQNDLNHQIRQRNYLVVITVLFLVIAVILTFRYFEKKKVSEELNRINIVKDKFFRIIAHDLREPFGATFSALGLLRDQYDELSETEKKDAIEVVSGLIKKDFDLLENLLMWAKNQRREIKFEPSTIYLQSVVDKIIALVSSRISAKNILVENICGDNDTVLADEEMLNAILRNVIFNAVKFTNHGGQITISCNHISEESVITIKDNGIGMDKNTIKDLFSLDTKNTSIGTAGESGSGLGMILVKEFVDMHKGKIEIESESGKGTTVTIILPSKKA